MEKKVSRNIFENKNESHFPNFRLRRRARLFATFQSDYSVAEQNNKVERTLKGIECTRVRIYYILD